MEFRTPVPPLSRQGLLDHTMPIWTIGSCFSDTIGERLRREGFLVTANPLGTLFNPISIADALDRVVGNRLVDADSLVESQGQWHSMGFHSRWSSADKEKAASGLNARISLMHDALPRLKALIVTFGSAIGHRLLATGEIVGNCHKLPAREFAVEPISVEQITAAWLPLMSTLKEAAPGLKFIFTVSPVRHLAYGAAADKLSKARLLLAVDALVGAHAESAVYFPAYEIMNDDLRDYRFYAPDMVHPSEQAADYIYSVFKQSFFDTDTEALAAKCLDLTRRREHRPLTDNPEAIARFNESTRRLEDSIYSQHPFLKTADELFVR